MFTKIQALWKQWKNTAVGKAVEDYVWYLVAAVAYVAVDATSFYLTSHQSSLTETFGPYGAILLVGAIKAVSYLRDRMKDPRVKNTPFSD